MKNKNLLLMFSVFFVLLIGSQLVSAQPPFQTQPTLLEGYFIEIPEQGTLLAGRNFTFFFHVFNLSDGLPLTDNLVNCEFNLHDSSSGIVYSNTNLPFDTTTHAFSTTIIGANFTSQEFTYVTHCNSTDFGGVVSVGLVVTPTGFPSEPFPIEFGLILFSFLIIIMGYWKVKLRLLKTIGGIALMAMGVITLFPGYSTINHSVLTGQVLGVILILLGFFFLMEEVFYPTAKEENEGGED